MAGALLREHRVSPQPGLAPPERRAPEPEPVAEAEPEDSRDQFERELRASIAAQQHETPPAAPEPAEPVPDLREARRLRRRPMEDTSSIDHVQRGGRW
jgi:hypothetical protein